MWYSAVYKSVLVRLFIIYFLGKIRVGTGVRLLLIYYLKIFKVVLLLGTRKKYHQYPEIGEKKEKMGDKKENRKKKGKKKRTKKGTNGLHL